MRGSKYHGPKRYRENCTKKVVEIFFLFLYLPTCRIPSEVCKSGGEPVVNLVQSQLPFGGLDHCLHGVINKQNNNIGLVMISK